MTARGGMVLIVAESCGGGPIEMSVVSGNTILSDGSETVTLPDDGVVATWYGVPEIEVTVADWAIRSVGIDNATAVQITMRASFIIQEFIIASSTKLT